MWFICIGETWKIENLNQKLEACVYNFVSYNLILRNKKTGLDVGSLQLFGNFVSNTIYMEAQLLAQTAYIFSSYNVVNWLKKYDAIIDEKVRWTKHSYTSRPNDDDLIFIGKLDLDFELKLSYW